jgi:hypothetical protein
VRADTALGVASTACLSLARFECPSHHGECLASLADHATGSALTSSHSLTQAPKKEGDAAAAPTTTQGPGAREGEHVFGVARILASFNDTFVYVPSAVQRSKAVAA